MSTEQTPIQIVDIAKPLNLFSNLGANATLNVKASKGKVFSLQCHNLNAATRYIQLHDTATTPSAAAVPKYTFAIPAGLTVIVGTDFFGQGGVEFVNGVAFAFSTTEATYTAATATDQMTFVNYR